MGVGVSVCPVTERAVRACSPDRLELSLYSLLSTLYSLLSTLYSLLSTLYYY
jgi:hypothetical protein